jgi:hypothetical protein
MVSVGNILHPFTSTETTCCVVVVFAVLHLTVTIRPIRVITKLPNSEQSYKGKVKTHKYINRQNQSTTCRPTRTNYPDCIVFGTTLTTILPILFQYCYKYCYSDNRNL